jgi:hypothetical protein
MKPCTKFKALELQTLAQDAPGGRCVGVGSRVKGTLLWAKFQRYSDSDFGDRRAGAAGKRYVISPTSANMTGRERETWIWTELLSAAELCSPS